MSGLEQTPGPLIILMVTAASKFLDLILCTTLPYLSNSSILSNNKFEILKEIFFSDIINLKGLGHSIRNL